jgi:hypothetical protein
LKLVFILLIFNYIIKYIIKYFLIYFYNATKQNNSLEFTLMESLWE